VDILTKAVVSNLLAKMRDYFWLKTPQIERERPRIPLLTVIVARGLRDNWSAMLARSRSGMEAGVTGIPTG
jgi:hypothetical protein